MSSKAALRAEDPGDGSLSWQSGDVSCDPLTATVVASYMHSTFLSYQQDGSEALAVFRPLRTYVNGSVQYASIALSRQVTEQLLAAGSRYRVLVAPLARPYEMLLCSGRAGQQEEREVMPPASRTKATQSNINGTH